jgi:hypothetical protein
MRWLIAAAFILGAIAPSDPGQADTVNLRPGQVYKYDFTVQNQGLIDTNSGPIRHTLLRAGEFEFVASCGKRLERVHKYGCLFENYLGFEDVIINIGSASVAGIAGGNIESGAEWRCPAEEIVTYQSPTVLSGVVGRGSMSGDVISFAFRQATMDDLDNCNYQGLIKYERWRPAGPR